jgi:hypothetical protein
MRPLLQFLPLLLPALLAAQVTGVVHDPSSIAIAEVLVELWSPTERLAVTTTSPTGRFSFALDSAATGLWIRRVGYRAKQFSLGGITSDVAVVLTPLPLELADLSKRAVALCPHKEEPAARAVMARLIEHYSQRLDSLGVFTWFWYSSGRVSSPGMESFDTARMGYGQTGASGSGNRFLARQLDADGYAVRSSGDMMGDFDLWQYARLHFSAARHFATPLFLQRHRFFVVDGNAAVQQVGFCPADRKQPEIEGILEVADGSAIVRATWRFVTPRPLEEAGGEATIAPPPTESGARPLLLPVTGLYWRKLWNNHFHQSAYLFDAWRIGTTDSIPRVPRQKR